MSSTARASVGMRMGAIMPPPGFARHQRVASAAASSASKTATTTSSTSNKGVLVWFRRDLRLADNETLHAVSHARARARGSPSILLS